MFQILQEETKNDAKELQEEKKSNKLKRERLKGRQIKQQQEIEELLIELFIHTQQMVSDMNRLPQCETFAAIKADSAAVAAGSQEDSGEDHLKIACKKTKASVRTMMDDTMREST